MTDNETQLKLQAFLDGELPEAEAARMVDRLARDTECQALFAELTATSHALAGFETGVTHPESREFFWSKVARQIDRAAKPAARPSPTPWLRLVLARWLTPAAAVAVLAAATLVSFHSGLLPGQLVKASAPPSHADIADSGAFTYRDFGDHTTLVWLSYPADSEVADAEPPVSWE